MKNNIRVSCNNLFFSLKDFEQLIVELKELEELEYDHLKWASLGLLQTLNHLEDRLALLSTTNCVNWGKPDNFLDRISTDKSGDK